LTLTFSICKAEFSMGIVWLSLDAVVLADILAQVSD
jgi:hypothetical protein